MRKMLTQFLCLRGTIPQLLVLIFLIAPVMVVKAETNPVAGSPQQEQKTITGTVTDGAGNSLPGVSVYIKGSSEGTVTDLDGKFTIKAMASDALVFRYVGYLTEEIIIGDQTTINVTLKEDIIGLDEIVVTGYGIQKKSDITGSIASVSSEKLNEEKIPSVDQALQGLAAGVNVIPTSGRPGDAAIIQIRGITSVNGIEPLIIIDGVPADNLNGVSSSDIKSIEILKDASSAAIYGDTGGNGVIIVTTKSGSVGKIKTNLNFYYGIESPVGRLNLMNSEQFLSTVEEKYPGNTAISSRPDTFPNYNWQDIIFEPGITQNYDLSTTGGTETSQYLFSASYNNQTGIIRSSDYERITLRLNSSHKLSERIKLDNKFSYSNIKRNGLPDWQWNAYYDGPVRVALMMDPTVPDYNPDGTWANSNFGGSNPLAMLDMIDRLQKSDEMKANVALTIDIVEGLSFTSRFAGGMSISDTKEYQNSYFNTVYDLRNDEEVKILAGLGRGYDYTAQQLLNYNITLAANHDISLMAGMEANKYWGYDYRGERLMAPNMPDNLQYFLLSSNDTIISQIVEGGAYEGRASAYLARLNYAYKDKYLLTINARRSGRSSFGPNNRFGVFPSFSAGWKFSNEAFMMNQSLINFGKIRIGYGQMGTYSRSGTPYLSIVRSPQTLAYPFDNTVAFPGAAPIKIANSEIHWETIHMTNIGIDLAMLQNRLSFTAEYYNKVNQDMLMLQEVPYIVGTYTLGTAWDIDDPSPEVNIGSVSNSGLEFTFGYKEQTGDLKYHIDLNLSTVKNKVLELASDSLTGGSVHNVSPITMTRIGGSVSEFYGYKTDGIFTRDDCATDANGNYIRNAAGYYVVVNQPYTTNSNGDIVYAQPNAQPGDVRYVDVNEDGRVRTPEDKVILGSPLPKLIFGFSVKLEYKGFDFAAQFNGTLGNKIFNGTKQYLYYNQEYTNHYTDFANRYVDADIIKQDPITGQDVVVVRENSNTTVPRNNVQNYASPSDFYIEDASYLRIRNLSFGYTIPQKLTQSVHIEKLKLYVGARNLYTLTKYTGINPEIGQGGILDMGIDASIYPVTKMFYFGANLSF